MLQSCERRPPGAGEETPERRLAGEIGAESHGIDEVAHDARPLRRAAPGGGGAHREVVLAGVAPELGLPAGGEEREESGALRRREPAERRREIRRQLRAPGEAPPGLDRRPRPIGRQGEVGHRPPLPGERLAPEAREPLALGSGQPGGLPASEVGVGEG